VHSTFSHSSHFPFCPSSCCHKRARKVQARRFQAWILHYSSCVLRFAASCVVFCVLLAKVLHSVQGTLYACCRPFAPPKPASSCSCFPVSVPAQTPGNSAVVPWKGAEATNMAGINNWGWLLYTLYLNIPLSKIAIVKCGIIIDNRSPWLGDAIAEEMVIFGCFVVADWPIQDDHVSFTMSTLYQLCINMDILMSYWYKVDTGLIQSWHTYFRIGISHWIMVVEECGLFCLKGHEM
jgi:hypothetical protein